MEREENINITNSDSCFYNGFSPARSEDFENSFSCSKPPMVVNQDCCCKKSMIDSLKLLCDTELANLIDFERFAFISDSFIVGAKLVLLKIGSDEKDNLSNLEGKFKRFSPGNCDIIDIEGTACYNFPLIVSASDLKEQLTSFIKQIIDIIGVNDGVLGTTADILKEVLKIFDPLDFTEELFQAILDFILKYFTTLTKVNAASICNLQSIAFQIKDVTSTSSDDKTGYDLTGKNYEKAKKLFMDKLDRRCNGECGECKCNCDCENCCCNKGVKNELIDSNLSKKATITAGNLTLRDALVLGTKGNVMVFANDKKRRFYFVCENAVQFLG